RHAALHVPAADRLRGSRRGLGQHRRPAEPHELRAPARERTHARRAAGRRRRRRLARRRHLDDDGGDDREGERSRAGRRAHARLPGIPEEITMLSRRVFMKNGGLALLSLGFAPAFLARTVEAASATRRKILITIFQRGAVDGLNMIVPFGEKDYYAARPSIAVPRPGPADGAVDLDGFFGLHPRLASLKPLWDSKQLAIVHATGSPDGTRSHFDAQDYMESGTPGVKSTQDGWLNRYLHAREHAEATPFRAVALAPQMPRSLQGIEPALAIGQIGQFGIRAGQATDMVQASFESEYAAAADKVLNKTGGQAFDAVRMLKSADPGKSQPENGADYPRSGYGEALRQIAQLVKADVGLEVAFAEAGGWDTH